MPLLKERNPLIQASCPKTLGTLADDSFGATTRKLGEVAKIYYRCRCAALELECGQTELDN